MKIRSDRAALAGGAGLLLAVSVPGGLAAAAQAPAPSAAVASRPEAPATPAVPPGRTLDLRPGYLAALAHVRLGPVTGVVYARGHEPVSPRVRSAAVEASCTEPNCPLIDNGGPVQHAPRVYLLFWGPLWSTNSTEEAVANYLTSFYSGLGVAPQDTWSTITSQYSDGGGVPTFGNSVYVGPATYDPSTPPTGATQAQLGAEADSLASNLGITGQVNAQVIVATQSGTCPQGFYAPSCAGGTGSYCAWHSYSSEPFTNLPFLLDSGFGCGENAVQGQDDGFSIVGGHEYAETVTDPEPDSGWIDPNDNSGGEIGDKCAWSNLGTVALSTGSFAVQPLYSNSSYSGTGTGCTRTGPVQPTVNSFSPSTGSLGSAGGPVTLNWDLSSTTTCTLASSPDVTGGTESVPCSDSGTDSVQVQLAGNTGSSAETYTFTLTARGSTGSAPAVQQTEVSVTAAPSTTTTGVTVATSNPVAGEPITLDVQVTGQSTLSGTPAPSGSVTVGDGTRTCLAAVSGSNGSATGSCLLVEPSVGTYSVRGSFGGDSNFSSSSSNPVSLAIGRAATRTGVTVSASKVTYGEEQLVKFSVDVLPQFSGVPAGGVALEFGNTVLCRVTALSGGKGSCALTPVERNVATWKVTAAYGGSTSFLPSSATVDVVVTRASSATALTLSAGKVVVGHENLERFTVAVKPQFSGSPTGKVNVFTGSRVLCTVTLVGGKGSCSPTASALAVHAYTVAAAYTGSVDFAGSLSKGQSFTVVG